MNGGLKQLFKDNGIPAVLIGVVVMYGLYSFFVHLNSKGASTESMRSSPNPAYADQAGAPSAAQPKVRPSDPTDQSGSYAPASGSGGGGEFAGATCGGTTDPSQLLPQDSNAQWSKTNPIGTGNLANVNLLKAGEHIGIDTIGSTLKNPNLQLRSEPIIPKDTSGATGIWNQSTYEPDLMRPSFEIGQGPQ